MAGPERGERGIVVSRPIALSLVFGTSFCVLVLEILAGRLLAPLIGVSLETFTGIIGTVLAGIAIGNAAGGRLADRLDPSKLIGPILIVAGLLTWLAPVLTSALSPVQSADAVTIVFLSAVTFFGPAALLSAITPMVAKLQLRDLADTGRIVGNLSAAGTAGALVGTFLTGFVLVAAFPTRGLIFAVGVVLVLVGMVFTGWARLSTEPLALGLVVAVGAGALLLPSPCDAETSYACVEIVVDPARPTGRRLVLNRSHNSYVDLVDPTYLDFRYMRLFADVAETVPGEGLEALHLGGAGFTFPRYLNAVRPGSRQTVLELDEELVVISRRYLGLEESAELRVVVGDARLTIAGLDNDRYDVVFADAFSGLTVPWHLTTEQFVAELDRVLSPNAIVVANLIDGGDLGFVRAEIATYATRFEHVVLIAPPEGVKVERARNFVLVASHVPTAVPTINSLDGQLLSATETAALVGEARILTDDHAPVDQLREAR